ncbi:insulinase family protein, partial [Microbacteriaceae bacterium K1510]|nr:insulinase family protein [Microbacteriaceae bacterium K1510]
LKVVAVGDITAAELGALLDEVFGALPLHADLAPVLPIASLPAGRQAVVEMDVPQSVAVFGTGGIARQDPDYMAGILVNHIVGGGG